MNDSKIRKAVGAIVFKNGEYLLVHKVKNINMNETQSITTFLSPWDFVKGGVEEGDIDFETAILRELEEETGSCNYKIIKKFHKKICFEFPKEHKYHKQNTVMFYVEYLGDCTDLKPRDDEIDNLMFYSREEVKNLIKHKETIRFLNKADW